jgi:hypothetical protein
MVGFSCRKSLAPGGPGRNLRIMQKDILQNQQDILECERSCALDIAFLVQHVFVAADEWMKTHAVDILRSAGKGDSTITDEGIRACFDKFKDLKADRRHSCLSKSMSDDVDSLTSFLWSMVAGGPSTPQYTITEGTSDFMKTNLGVICDWYVVSARDMSKGGAMFKKSLIYRGKEAANLEFKRLQELSAEADVAESDLCSIRKFAWMLDGPAQSQVHKWIVKLVKNAGALVLDKMMLMDKASADKAIDVVAGKVGTKTKLVGKTSVASDARSSTDLLPACKKSKSVLSKVSQKDRMLAICSGAV